MCIDRISREDDVDTSARLLVVISLIGLIQLFIRRARDIIFTMGGEEAKLCEEVCFFHHIEFCNCETLEWGFFVYFNSSQ